MVKKLQVIISGVVVHEQDGSDFNMMMIARQLQRTWKIKELRVAGVDCGVYKTLESGVHKIDTLKEDWFDHLIPVKENYDEEIYLQSEKITRKPV